MDSHSSGMSVAEHLKQPTRIQHGSCRWIPIWSCSEWGLPCHLCCHRRGALLPHHFNLTGPAGLRRYIFCCTCHRFTPSRRYLALYPVEPGLSSVASRNYLQRLPGQLDSDYNTNSVFQVSSFKFQVSSRKSKKSFVLYLETCNLEVLSLLLKSILI